MKKIADRIYAVRKDKHMTQQVFADIVGISRNYLSEVENDKGKVPVDAIVGIAINMPEINLTWLLTGEGEMYHSPLSTIHFNNCPEWLMEWWTKAEEKERGWLEVELKRLGGRV